MADYPIGTGNEQQILERRRLNAQKGLEPFDLRDLSVKVRPVIRFWDASEGQVWLDTGDAARPSGSDRGTRT